MWIRHFDKISFASECVQNALAIGIEAGNRAHAAAWVKRRVQRGISRYLRISTLLKPRFKVRTNPQWTYLGWYWGQVGHLAVQIIHYIDKSFWMWWYLAYIPCKFRCARDERIVTFVHMCDSQCYIVGNCATLLQAKRGLSCTMSQSELPGNRNLIGHIWVGRMRFSSRLREHVKAIKGGCHFPMLDPKTCNRSSS